MTSRTDFRTRLAALGLSQVELRRWIEHITGHRLAPTTTSRWAKGHRSLPPEMNALLAVIEDPKLLGKLCISRGPSPRRGSQAGTL